MKKPLIILTPIFVILIGVLLWWFSDSQVIKRNTRALAATLTLAADESKSTRALKGQNFAALLASDFAGSVDIENYEGNIRRDEAITGHQYLSLSCESSHVTATDIEITSIDDNTATVTATLGVLVTLKGGRSYNDSADATLTWQKTEDAIWELKSATLHKSP